MAGAFKDKHTQTKGKHGAGAAGLTLLFEGEVLCEMPALVVASEEEEGVGMVDLQSPEVQYTLRRQTHGRGRLIRGQPRLNTVPK